MAQLVVRNLDDDVKRRLQDRAARRGHSMEEEVRDILRTAAVAWDDEVPPEPLGSWIARRFAGLGVTMTCPSCRARPHGQRSWVGRDPARHERASGTDAGSG